MRAWPKQAKREGLDSVDHNLLRLLEQANAALMPTQLRGYLQLPGTSFRDRVARLLTMELVEAERDERGVMRRLKITKAGEAEVLAWIQGRDDED